MTHIPNYPCFFFFNDTATTEIYTLSLHDALPISASPPPRWETTSSTSGCRSCRSASRRRGTRCWRRCARSEEHTSELQSQSNLVCRLLLEKKYLLNARHQPLEHTNARLSIPRSLS